MIKFRNLKNITILYWSFTCILNLNAVAQELNKSDNSFSFTNIYRNNTSTPLITLPEDVSNNQELKPNQTDEKSTISNNESNQNQAVVSEIEKPLQEEQNLNTNFFSAQANDKPQEPIADPFTNSKNSEKLITTLNEKKDNEFSLVKTTSLVIAFLSALGLVYFILLKIRAFSRRDREKPEKLLEIVSTLALSPKRQLMIVRVKDKEIVVSNTESGINFLSEIDAQTIPYTRKSLYEERPIQLMNNNYDSQAPKQTVSNNQKSEILKKIIDKTRLTEKQKTQTQEVDEKKPQFSKLYANAFETEMKRSNQDESSEDSSVENVTKLIRDKLRSMKPVT